MCLTDQQEIFSVLLLRWLFNISLVSSLKTFYCYCTPTMALKLCFWRIFTEFGFSYNCEFQQCLLYCSPHCFHLRLRVAGLCEIRRLLFNKRCMANIYTNYKIRRTGVGGLGTGVQRRKTWFSSMDHNQQCNDWKRSMTLMYSTSTQLVPSKTPSCCLYVQLIA